MTTAIAPLRPRLVTPPMRLQVRFVAVLAVVAGLVLGVSGVTARTSSPRATAIVVERSGSRQLVSVIDGPRPGRFVVDWADEIPIGQPFTVGLGAACGCVPQPAVLGARRQPDLGTVAVALALLALPATALVRGSRQARAGREAQHRSGAVVGVGPGPIVHLLPVWTTEDQPLHAELWREDGALLGRVGLARVDRAFDPAVPFVAWGGPQAGGAVALTSVDGRQLVLPTSGLTDAAAPPAADPAVTAATTAVLGWPSRTGPTDPTGASRVDAAIDALRSRERWTTGLAAILALALGFVIHRARGAGWTPTLAALVLVLGLAAAVLHVHTRAPLRALIEPVVGSNPRVREKVLAALLQARGRRTDDGPAHGPATPADGAGWTPSTPARR